MKNYIFSFVLTVIGGFVFLFLLGWYFQDEIATTILGKYCEVEDTDTFKNGLEAHYMTCFF